MDASLSCQNLLLPIYRLTIPQIFLWETLSPLFLVSVTRVG